jgi:hypothetical protein
LLTDTVDGIAQGFRFGIVQLHKLMRVGCVVDREQAIELARREDRRVEQQTRRVFGGFDKQVLLPAETGLQRHDDLLAQRINGRIRDLCKLLAEVVVQGAHLARQYR